MGQCHVVQHDRFRGCVAVPVCVPRTDNGGHGWLVEACYVAALGGPLRCLWAGCVKCHVVCRLVASRSGYGLVVGDGTGDAQWPPRRSVKIAAAPRGAVL